MTPTNQKEEKIVDLRTPPQGTQAHPWLLMWDTRKPGKQVFYSISEGRYHTKNIPEMIHKRIFSFNGDWLVTVDYGNRECYLLNVVSMEKVELPKYRELNFCYVRCFLKSTPEDPNCHVVFMEEWCSGDHSLCQPGDDDYIAKESIFPKDDERLRCTTFFNGSIYGLGESTFSLLRANLNDPSLEFQYVFRGGSMENILLGNRPHCYLIESCGELLLVMRYHLHDDVCDFQVFRADFSTLEWDQLTSISDRAIFLEEYSTQGYSCSASGSGIQENCIYYTEAANRLLYIFNLENGTSTSIMPCPTLDSRNVFQQWVMIPPTSTFPYHSKS